MSTRGDDVCSLPTSISDAKRDGWTTLIEEGPRRIFTNGECYFKTRSKEPDELYNQGYTECNVLNYLHECGNFTDIPTCYGYGEFDGVPGNVQNAMKGMEFIEAV